MNLFPRTSAVTPLGTEYIEYLVVNFKPHPLPSEQEIKLLTGIAPFWAIAIGGVYN